MAPVITEYASWILFAWTLANQGGVPVPAVPALLGAGALAGSGRLSIAVILAVALGATLCADLGWYSLGRWRGAGALEVLGNVSPQAAKCVRYAEQAFLGRPRTFQLVARFLPELNPIAAGLAGVTRQSLARFVGYGAMSALAWAGAWVTLGYLLNRTLTEISAYFEIPLLGLGVALLLLYVPVRRARRHRLLRTHRARESGPMSSAVGWKGGAPPSSSCRMSSPSDRGPLHTTRSLFSTAAAPSRRGGRGRPCTRASPCT